MFHTLRILKWSLLNPYKTLNFYSFSYYQITLNLLFLQSSSNGRRRKSCGSSLFVFCITVTVMSMCPFVDGLLYGRSLSTGKIVVHVLRLLHPSCPLLDVEPRTKRDTKMISIVTHGGNYIPRDVPIIRQLHLLLP